jgi:hypothetical protein
MKRRHAKSAKTNGEPQHTHDDDDDGNGKSRAMPIVFAQRRRHARCERGRYAPKQAPRRGTQQDVTTECDGPYEGAPNQAVGRPMRRKCSAQELQRSIRHEEA